MAKEEIYTIPLWDAVKDEGECPFCFLEKKLEKDLIDFCLSDAYMQSDFRQTTNKIGFCQSHFRQLFQSPNRLGLTLVNQSHTMEMLEEFKKATQNLKSTKKLFKKKTDEDNPIHKLYQRLTDECYICGRINETMTRYFETFFYLYKKDAAFRDFLPQTKSFCMPHYLRLIEVGQTNASPSVFENFMEESKPHFIENMERVLADMQWFVNKFDYRNDKEPWKDAKDAPKRSIQKINGTLL